MDVPGRASSPAQNVPGRRRLPEVNALAQDDDGAMLLRAHGPTLLSPMTLGSTRSNPVRTPRTNASQHHQQQQQQPQQPQQQEQQQQHAVTSTSAGRRQRHAPAPFPEGAHFDFVAPVSSTMPTSGHRPISASKGSSSTTRNDAYAPAYHHARTQSTDPQDIYVNAHSLSKSQGFMQNYLHRDSYQTDGRSGSAREGGTASSYSATRMSPYGNHALQYRYPSRLVEVSLTLKEPGHDEVLVQVTHSGVSATDLHILADSAAPHIVKIVPGQDVVGKVVSMGRNVTGLNLNDLVCVCPHFVPPMDEFSRSERVTVGRDSRSMGINKNGAWGQFCCVNAVQVYKLAPEFQPEWAVLTHEMSAVLNGWRKLQASLKHEFPRILVVGGSGIAGILWLLLLKSKGIPDLQFLDSSSQRARVAREMHFSSSVLTQDVLRQLERHNQNNNAYSPAGRVRHRKSQTRRKAPKSKTPDMTFAGAATSTSYAKSLYASSFAQKMAEHFHGNGEFTGNETSESSVLGSETQSEDSALSSSSEKDTDVVDAKPSSDLGPTAQVDKMNLALEQIGSMSLGLDDKDFSAVETSGAPADFGRDHGKGTRKGKRSDRPRRKLGSLGNMLECVHPPVMGHFDVIIDCSGDGNLLHGLLHVVLPGGTVLLNGTGMESSSLLVSPIHLYSKELRIIGATAHPSTFVDALVHVHRIQEDVGSLSALGARLYSISDYNIALSDARLGEVTKSLFWMSDPQDRHFLANPSTPLLSPAQTPMFNVPILSL